MRLYFCYLQYSHEDEESNEYTLFNNKYAGDVIIK